MQKSSANTLILRYPLLQEYVHLVHWHSESKSTSIVQSSTIKEPWRILQLHRRQREILKRTFLCNFSRIGNLKMRLGKTHLEIASRWLPSAMTYGTASGLAVLYFTDWKAVLQYVPYWNGKYTE